LTEEEKSLTAKFLANHEKSMMSLRAQTLSNGFAPAFVFISPIMKGSSGK
ncbi:MAG: hypothetical protein HY961_18240, partial [Ignavibacteriae bacterium]|nr:hypothetical protein [Ignavibacteriota bacterium]